MPLAFATLNRGVIPFGFFNVESDMLLLAEHFLFADAFCGSIEQLAHGAPGLRLPVWSITDRDALGDFHGAMSGTELWGFFGAVYRRFPFPAVPEDFHQRADGGHTQDEMRLLADQWAQPGELVLTADPAAATVDLGGYRFDPAGFAALVLYLWQGGAPRWMAGVRPPYVERMMRTVRAADSWLFIGVLGAG
jgi:hypothetical protein